MLLTLYTAPGCCLCDAMKAQIEELRQQFTFELQVRDITASEELERQFRPEIPVLFIDGRKVAKYRIETEALRRALATRR